MLANAMPEWWVTPLQVRTTRSMLRRHGNGNIAFASNQEESTFRPLEWGCFPHCPTAVLPKAVPHAANCHGSGHCHLNEWLSYHTTYRWLPRFATSEGQPASHALNAQCKLSNWMFSPGRERWHGDKELGFQSLTDLAQDVTLSHVRTYFFLSCSIPPSELE